MKKLALFSLLSLAAFPAFAAVDLSLGALVSLIIYLLIIGCVVWLLLFLVGYIAPPEPFNKVLRVIIMVVAVLLLIGVLLGFAGHSVVNFR